MIKDQSLQEMEDFLDSKLSLILRKSGSNRNFNIVIDGKFYTKQSKVVTNNQVVNGGYRKVYIRYNSKTKENQPSITFFFKASESNSSDTLSRCITDIATKMLDTKLNKIQFGGVASPSDVKITLDSQFNIIFIKSPVYYLATELYKSYTNNPNNEFQTVATDHLTLDPSFVRSVIDEIKASLIVSYIDLIYSRPIGNFFNILYRKNKLYSTLKMFVPVFIDYNKLPNPILTDPIYMKDYNKLYQKAVEVNRKVEHWDNETQVLSCYFLTHLEICEALGLTHFMRFTPLFLYKLMVGLIDNSMTGFPGSDTEIYMLPNPSHCGLPKRISKQEYFRHVNATQEALADPNITEQESEKMNQKLNELKSYIVVSSLEYHLKLEHSKLTSIGTNYLDSRESTSFKSLKKILEKATIIER